MSCEDEEISLNGKIHNQILKSCLLNDFTRFMLIKGLQFVIKKIHPVPKAV